MAVRRCGRRQTACGGEIQEGAVGVERLWCKACLERERLAYEAEVRERELAREAAMRLRAQGPVG